MRSQSFLETYLKVSKDKSFTDSKVSIDSLLQNVVETTSPEALELINYIALDRFKAKDYNNCIEYSLLETAHYSKTNNSSKSAIEALDRLGKCYYLLKDYPSSIKYHRKTIALDSFQLKTASSYSQIGQNYYRLGDFFKAETYLKAAIKKLELGKNYNLLLNVYFVLVRVYIKIDTNDSHIAQLSLLQKAEALKSKFKFSSRQELILNNYFAGYYNSVYSYDFDKSKSFYLKNLELAKKVKDTAYLCATCINLGDIYNEGKRPGAIPYLKKSLEYCKDDDYYIYHQMGFAYLNKGELIKALEYMDKSIDILTASNTNAKSFTSDDFEHITDKLNLMLAFDRKAEILLKTYKANGNIKDVKKALEQLTLIDEFIDTIEAKSTEEQSQLYWRKNASKTYSKAIECANILGRSDLAFYFNEKSKALLLTESILKNDMAVSLPKHISEKENRFKKDILRLENIPKHKNNNVIKDSLFQIKFDYQKFTDSLKVAFPGYYNNKSKAQLSSLKDVKKQLDTNTIVISYNWDTSLENNTLNGLAFTKTTTQTFSIDNTTEINNWIKTYLKLLHKPLETKADSDSYKHVAYRLFTSLFPLEIKNQLEGKHILIIPDGNLQNMPFEALITQENSAAYLIKKNTVSYAYSMSFLINNQAIKRAAAKDFVGFAPVSFTYNDLTNLNNSASELKRISDIIEGEEFLNSKADKTTFIRESSQSKIIHLATHAQASSNPWIAFSDNHLKLHELYTHKLNADLVVLSACNTAIGKQFQGEGVFNLARGFFYSGANSVISTQWAINDESTSSIMSDFYQNLKNGKSKSQALQQAQLAYINTHNLSQASPYYWAPFVLVGDYNNATLKAQNNIYIFLLLGLIALIIFASKFLHN